MSTNPSENNHPNENEDKDEDNTKEDENENDRPQEDDEETGGQRQLTDEEELKRAQRTYENSLCGIVSDNATNNQVMVRELKQLKWPRFKGETQWI
ncbi:hypothetical protein PSTG_07725 [Puccinia striiformis f. sp. tritici PST-78]|uniref:Uncharacterized protein n=1 Tax=Puccinia striiformis f. sp. tritici PST-78 TaxID=1165861 RepID=A0A0L0VJB6_9BASI|nr:hypothetical protein PSTG_07725 [Puccinia striiformis f. sp. tritici PST-78]